MRYEDAFHYRRIFSPLIQLEAIYDRKTKESQTQNVGHVRWDQGLNKKHLAYFHLPKFIEGSQFLMLSYLDFACELCLISISGMKLMIGDELLLKHNQTIGKEWSVKGQVFKIPDS